MDSNFTPNSSSESVEVLGSSGGLIQKVGGQLSGLSCIGASAKYHYCQNIHQVSIDHIYAHQVAD